MEWIPDFRFGWLNGWIPLGLLTLTDGILFAIFPKDVVARLFDRSGWPRRQIIFTMIGKLLALVCLIQLICTPMKIGSPVFIIGTVMVMGGFLGLISVLYSFRNTPFDKPVTQGLYKISRHPQIVMSTIVLFGACVSIGSWSAFLMLVAARVFSHFGILAEEEICFQQYGDDYNLYLKQVPRYFIFF